MIDTSPVEFNDYTLKLLTSAKVNVVVVSNYERKSLLTTKLLLGYFKDVLAVLFNNSNEDLTTDGSKASKVELRNGDEISIKFKSEIPYIKGLSNYVKNLSLPKELEPFLYELLSNIQG